MRYPKACIAVGLSTLASCSSIEPAEVFDAETLHAAKTVYVVKHENSTRGVENELQTAFSRRGLRVRVGALERKPSDADLYVTFVDRWRWDIWMYLGSLDVSVFDGRTDSLVATGAYRNAFFFHENPDVGETADDVLRSIFEPSE